MCFSTVRTSPKELGTFWGTVWFSNLGTSSRNKRLFEELCPFQLGGCLQGTRNFWWPICYSTKGTFSRNWRLSTSSTSPRNYILFEGLCAFQPHELSPGTTDILRNCLRFNKDYFQQDLVTSWGTMCFSTEGTFTRNKGLFDLAHMGFQSHFSAVTSNQFYSDEAKGTYSVYTFC